MEDRQSIPIVKTPDEFEGLLKTGYHGIANVNLNSAMVEHMLTRNSANRKSKRESVAAYIASFLSHGYYPVGLMCVADDGTLLDGQHRLLALESIAKNGRTVDAWQYVQFGTPRERMADIDNGVVRSFSDTLRITGVIDDTRIASALRTYASFTCPVARIKFTAAELADIYNADFKHVLELGNFGCAVNVKNESGKRDYRPAPWVIAAFRLCQKKYGTERVDQAYDEMYTGTDLRQPMVWFRNYLVVHRGQLHVHGRTAAGLKLFGILFGAVGKCLNGEQCISYIRPAKLGLVVNGIEF